jgi:hypothetical protein
MAMTRRRMATTVLTTMAVAQLCDRDCTRINNMGWQSGWPATAKCSCWATHPRQQPINGDNLGRRRGERVAIWGDGTTDMGRGGGNLVETLELHKIASKPIFCLPQSSKRARTYFACILGVRLHYSRHDQHVFRAQPEA